MSPTDHTMNSNKYLLFVSIICFIFNHHSVAQITHDSGLWLSIGADKKLNKKQELYTKTQVRFMDNFQSFTYNFIDVGISNRITKGISIDISYVLNTRRRYVTESFVYQPRHQVYGNITFKKEIGKWRLANRNQFQTDLEDGQFSTSYNGSMDYFYRNKSTIKFKPNKKIEPYVFYEMYFRMNNKRDWEDAIYRHRICGGIEYNLTKRKSISCYYLFQQQVKRKGPDYVNAIGIAYNYTFKKTKKEPTHKESGHSS